MSAETLEIQTREGDVNGRVIAHVRIFDTASKTGTPWHRIDFDNPAEVGMLARDAAPLGYAEADLLAELQRIAIESRKAGHISDGEPAIIDTPAAGWRPDRLSQQANAEQLVKILNGSARFNHSRNDWMIRREGEGRLVMDETGVVARAAKQVARATWHFVSNPPPGIEPKHSFKHAIDSEKSAGISAMMKLAQTEPDISIVASDLDADPNLLNVLNGVVDSPAAKLRPHSRDDLLSKLAPVTFDANATCPRFDSFMDRIMAGSAEMIDYLRRLAGLCLTGDASIQELFIFWGGGANGKSVWIDTMIGMLGDYAGTAPESLLTMRACGAEHPTEIADLCGKRLVAASETEEGAKLRVQLVKRLTGDATIKARFMRCDYFEFPRTHKLILVTNNRPKITEATAAVWRRVRLIPFTVTIPPEERDTELLAKLREEWPGVLNWCLAGLRDYRQNGMQTPAEVTIATAEYQSEQDPLAEYLAERCIIEPDARVCRNEIYSDYQGWAKLVGDANPDRNGFYERLRRVAGVDEKMVRIGGRPTRVFTGIGLADLGTQYRQAQERAGQEV
ncbi:MAG TPA: phage/plasmid primase, P4 family [Tepidisphaeraceae bacterium]|nr:phage/plasmid primase, P4 family [Tepidisphaeraceae bacterium]